MIWSPYYFINFTIIISFYALRPFFPASEVLDDSSWGFSRVRILNWFAPCTHNNPKEIYIHICLVLLLFLKYLQALTLESFLATFFLLVEISIGIMLCFVQLKYFVWYAVLIFSISVLFPQPVYSGPKKVIQLDPVSLENSVFREKQSWIVLFQAAWSKECSEFNPVFARLCAKWTYLFHLFISFLTKIIDMERKTFSLEPSARPGTPLSLRTSKFPQFLLRNNFLFSYSLKMGRKGAGWKRHRCNPWYLSYS